MGFPGSGHPSYYSPKNWKNHSQRLSSRVLLQHSLYIIAPTTYINDINTYQFILPWWAIIRRELSASLFENNQNRVLQVLG